MLAGDVREYASSDPVRFLRDYPDGAIVDEVQRVPELMSFKNFGFWQGISGAPRDDCFLLYAGDRREERRECAVLPWTDLYDLPR